MKLYKYTPHIDFFLRDPLLKITPIYQLNDPFENALSDDALQKINEKLQKIPNISPMTTKNIIETIKNNQLLSGVISLSRSKNNIALMAYYANDFRGGILEFDIKEKDALMLLERSNDSIKYGKIIYTKNRPIDFYIPSNLSAPEIILFQKCHKWRHENEFRFIGDYRQSNYISIINSSSSSSNLIKKISNTKEIDGYIMGTLGKNNNLDLDWLPFWNSLKKSNTDYHPLMKINPKFLTGVYLGCRYPKDKFPWNELKKFNNLNGRVFFLELSATSYELIEKKACKKKN